MENPRLTFVTPTLVVGDQSLTDTIAHEIGKQFLLERGAVIAHVVDAHRAIVVCV
jgi:hypothetical protein